MTSELPGPWGSLRSPYFCAHSLNPHLFMSDRTSQIIRKLSRVNTYVVVVVFFLFITFVVGDSNLYKRYTYDEKIRRLEREIRHYKKEIETDRKKLDDIRTNREGLERYAREEFYMKRANEDVFIIED